MCLISLLHLALSSSVLISAFPHHNIGGGDVSQKFHEFIIRFNKSYEYGTNEFWRRETIFEQTLLRVDYLNKHRNSSKAALYGINQFSDMTPEEFKQVVHLTMYNVTAKKVYPMKNKFLKNPGMKHLPKRVDWRKKKIVSGVNNQEACGACWAFSIVETVESMYALKTGVLEKWSVQQVVDCAAPPNRGCAGGDTCLTIEWLYESDTNIVLDKDYPFVGKTQDCKEDVNSEKTVSIARNFTCDSFVGEEYLMLMHIAHHGPVIAAVDATNWQDYVGGIVQDNCEQERNHAVQIVGYDISGEVPYYIVRNSWGKNFGNNGYLNIIIGKNMCRVAEEVSAVDVI